jgi:hypothetical protein
MSRNQGEMLPPSEASQDVRMNAVIGSTEKVFGIPPQDREKMNQPVANPDYHKAQVIEDQEFLARVRDQVKALDSQPEKSPAQSESESLQENPVDKVASASPEPKKTLWQKLTGFFG